MGASILRFRRADNVGLVLKYASAENAQALSDLEGNIHGYEQMKANGASFLVPPDVQVVNVPSGVALAMRDLGKNTTTLNEGIHTWRVVAENLEGAVRATVQRNEAWYAEEVFTHMRKFVPNDEIEARFRRAVRTQRNGRSALMLLDLTPDNMFVSGESAWFLDPWRQTTYQGHPGVSLGQFATLVRIYGLRDAQPAFQMFEELAVRRVSSILECEERASMTAFRLGQTLQLVLSAHVRRDTEPEKAQALYQEALDIMNDL